MGKMKVLVVSQQTFFRQGIWHSLSANTDMDVTTADTIDREIMSTVEKNPPDISILDVDGSSDDSLLLARKLKQRLPGMGLIVLSSDRNDNHLFQALKVQASAYLKKDVTPEELDGVVRSVSRGEAPINEAFTARQEVAMQVLRKFQELAWHDESEVTVSPLTSRETEILNYVAQGYLNKKIATELGISEQTIKNHVTSILRKLNANARTEAVVLAIKQGLITIS